MSYASDFLFYESAIKFARELRVAFLFPVRRNCKQISIDITAKTAPYAKAWQIYAEAESRANSFAMPQAQQYIRPERPNCAEAESKIALKTATFRPLILSINSRPVHSGMPCPTEEPFPVKALELLLHHTTHKPSDYHKLKTTKRGEIMFSKGISPRPVLTKH